MPSAKQKQRTRELDESFLEEWNDPKYSAPIKIKYIRKNKDKPPKINSDLTSGINPTRRSDSYGALPANRDSTIIDTDEEIKCLVKKYGRDKWFQRGYAKEIAGIEKKSLRTIQRYISRSKKFT